MSTRIIQIKFDGSSDGFARAAKKAERDLSNWERSAKKTAVNIGKSGATMGATFIAQAGASLSKMGTKLFGLGGPLAVVALPVVALLATAAAATFSAAFTAGLAGGVIAGGIALVARDPKIKSAFSDLGNEMLQELTTAASVFAEPVMRSIDRIRVTFNNLDFRGIFASASRYVEPLAAGLLGLVRNVVPAIQRGVERAAPIIDVLSRNLPRIGDAIADAFDSITGNSEEAAGGLEYMFLVLEKIIRGGGAFIGFLTQAFGWLIRVGDAAGAVAETLLGWVPILGDQVAKGRESIDRIKASMEGAKTAGDNWTGGTIQLTTSQQLASDAQQQLWNRTTVLNSSMQAGINAAGGLSQAFMLLNGGALTAREAERGYQAAIDGVSASIKENGKSLDDNTAKGRANNQAIDGLVTSTDRKAQATYDEVAATKGAGAAQAAATKVYQDGRAELIKVGEKLFGNKQKAIEWADSIMQVPKSWTTTVTANTATGETQLKTFQRKIDGLHGKTVIVTVQERRDGHHVSGPGGSGTLVKDRWGGINYAMASGGTLGAHFTKSPTVLYGERETGGEAFIPRKGDMNRSRRIAETVVREWLNGEVTWGGSRQGATGGSSGVTPNHASGSTPEVHVYIGDQELRGIVRVEVSESNRSMKRRALAGAH